MGIHLMTDTSRIDTSVLWGYCVFLDIFTKSMMPTSTFQDNLGCCFTRATAETAVEGSVLSKLSL